jgi:probable HAF family extracellular repeat protein
MMQDIGNLQGGASYSSALGINNAGIIVGQGQLTTGIGTYVAFIYTGSQMTQLPSLPSQTGSVANAINSSGVVVGESGASDGVGPSTAVMWTGGTAQAIPMIPGAIVSEAFGINDAGQIVGFYVGSSEPSHAFVCTDGVCYDLNDIAARGKLADFEYLAQADAINASGTIVGYGYRKNPNGGVYGPFGFVAKPSVPNVVSPTPGQGMLTAAQNDPAPGLGTGSDTPVFSVTGPPAIDRNGDVAFRATIKQAAKSNPVKSTDNAGIWLYVGTVGSLVARTGDSSNPAPDTDGALFTKLSDPVLSSTGDLAFIGEYSGGPSRVHSTTGVFVKKNGGSVGLTVAAGEAAPGITGVLNPVFTGFSELAVLNGGGVAFMATVKGKGDQFGEQHRDLVNG